jgi:adenylosuccinate lyase
MPHKKNPILSERVFGLARLLRGYAASALENIALLHERDISHSSVERVIWPDAFNAAHYMTGIMKRVTDGLVVNERMIERNLELTGGLIASGRLLLALVERGMSREDAYAAVQENAMKCWDAAQKGERASLRGLLEADPRTSPLARGDGGLEELFRFDFFLAHVDEIFGRFQIFEKLGL